MIATDGAWALLRARFGAAAEEELNLREFDDAYVAWPKTPPRAEADRPPETVGNGAVVIERSSGDFYRRPFVGPAGTVRRWRADRGYGPYTPRPAAARSRS